MNKKKRFLKTVGLIYTEIPLEELKIFLHVFRPACHMCGRPVSFFNLGYIREFSCIFNGWAVHATWVCGLKQSR
jgi:hypothetical protein